MTASAVSSAIDNAYAPGNAYDLKSEAEQITAKNARDLHLKISVEVFKDTLEAEKAMAGRILDMLV
ncbi:hypothetical protein K8S19_03210 [bacterium]|nr:hypothetical protein [bacterium]